LGDLSRGRTPSDSAEAGTPEERLAEVTRLHDMSVLTDEEYQAKRAEIIAHLGETKNKPHSSRAG
jgi:hypothetical protein